ncbi:MAG: hypothetical protein OEW31_07960 [Thermoleophilia bacterium]|nr:hypothetical protein [Thermoleophilia bacterium]MDH4346252.1 hypothetical protein [Thermoleophilia bacterium]MDH5334379.1 hypothetical protein [Thermoleophilia bacterium]
MSVDDAERNAAVRRAELLLAAGGDPRRRLELDGRAVTSLAADLDEPERRTELLDGLASLAPEVEGLCGASEGLRVLRADPDLAWHVYALGLLAEELAAES